MKQLFLWTFWLLWAICIHTPLSTASLSCPEENTTHGSCECCGSNAPEHLVCRGIENHQNFREAVENLRCKITSDESTFKALNLRNATIVSLDLHCSLLQSISSVMFENFHNIIHLDLSQNQIAQIEGNAFGKLNLIEDLNLAHNSLVHIDPNWFHSLPNLKRLSLSGNKLKSISEDSFTGISSLEELDLSRNTLTDVNFRSNLTLLRYLDLSHNSIKSLGRETFSGLRDLMSVNLSHNKLVEVSQDAFRAFTNLKHINVSHNNLTFLPEELWVFLKDKSDIEGNPWDCVKNKPHTDEICQSEEGSKWWTGFLNSSNSKVQKEAICNTCVCDTRTTYVAVNCSNRNMDRLPLVLPNGTSTVILDNNRIKLLTFPPSSYQEWSTVTRLHLRNNSVSSLAELEKTNLLTKLQALDLRENRFTTLPYYMLELLSGVTDLYLGDNPWLCDCDNAVNFQNWLFAHLSIVLDVDRIRCGPDSGQLENRILSHIAKVELCPPPPEPIHYLDVINILMGISILLMVLKLGYDYWGQKRTGKLPQFFKLQVW